MKLHLPFSLRKALLAVLASTTYFSTADAACLHAAVSPTTYTDFGQNMARYSVYQVNDLLTQIRANNGVQIPYTTDTPPATMGVGQPMISFESMNGDGAFTAVGYNYTATVAHNGCPNPCFTGRYVGEDQAVHYQGVEYRSSQNKVFLLSPSIDYKITRSSKIFTDITASGVFDTTQFLRDGGQVTDLVHYRAGAGTCDQADFEGHTHNLAGGYAYITGGVVATLGFSYMDKSATYEGYDYTKDYAPNEGPRDSRGVIDDPYTISIRGIQDYGPGGAGQPSEENPKVYLLPFVSRGGDSGSPVWAWNEKTEAYELISCHQARGGDNSYSRGASEWTMAAMEYFNEHVDMDAAGHTVHLHGVVNVPGKSVEKYDETNKVGTTLQYGSITSDAAQDFATVYFCGVGEKGGKTIYTWLSLYDRKDVQNWYSYGNTYFNANGNGSGKDMHLGDLFYTENILFESDGSEVNNIILDADIDMGIGYAQFMPKEEGQTAKFYLQSKENNLGRDYMLNSAGYIVDEGAELHIQVTNTQKGADGNAYFREWRKQGAGDMFLEGQGDNEIFLNLGGKGTTYLSEEDGYAAYNVLINNGATLDFGGDVTQIARDVTFGNGGGYLEFSGLSSFDWYSGENSDVAAEGFTVNALTQDATLINSEGDTTLHYMSGGATTFLGSFQDTADSSLTVIYEGGGTWTLNSIHTKLLNEGSSFIVQRGTAELVGQLTVHGIGSLEGKGGTRYSHPDDWHYSDAAMDVVVQEGATFRLGSHARLTGNVDVQSGGTLEIAEGVKHRYEYIEGWLIAEDTYDPFYRQFYGLKGNVDLAVNSTLRFKFSEGTDAQNVYTYNITGDGNVDMQLGRSGATLVLSGENTFTGTKTLSGGGLVAEHETSLGDTNANKWLVKEDAFIAVKGIDGNQALTHIDAGSTGVIALTQDQTGQVDLNATGHTNMFVGALEGQVVQYGEAPKAVGSRTTYTETSLDTVTLDGSHYWQLGGGGGELVVNFLLDDPEAQLVLGNEYTTGTVTLTNVWNRIGSIYFAGKVTLNYTSEEALGGSKIALDYTNRVAGSPSIVKLLTRHSSGALMLDGMENADVDLFDHQELFLGSQGLVEYSGTITAGGDAYRFGGITGTLVLNKALAQEDGTPLNLIVDAQTYSGGTLALAKAAEITGSVTVMGHDAERAGFTGGDITLRTDVDDAIASATRVTLQEGGILDVNGTEQTLHGFNMEAGSLLTDSSANWNGVVTLEVGKGEISTLAGAVDVNYLVKNGEGTLLLAGDNAYGNLIVNNGLVQLQNGNSLSAVGITMLEDGGVLDFSGGFDVTGTVAFSGGTAKVGGKAVNGALMVGTAGDGTPETGTLLQETAGTSTRINASVEVAEGSTLTLQGSNGTFVLSNTDINESGGTIHLKGHYLTIDRGGSDPVNVGGTIQLEGYGLSGNNRATLYSRGGANNMTRNINELNINGNAAIAEESWNTIWNIHCLTGEGDLEWRSATTHWFSAQLVLDGANTFTGGLTAKRTGGADNNRKYQAYLVIAHDQAAQYMDINATGSAANNFMSVAIDTENAEMKSLSSDNKYAVLYAGSAVAGSENDVGTPLATEPLSTRQAYLTLTGDGIHDFQGNVAGQDLYEQMRTKDDGSQEKIGEVENTGLSLVMNGPGTQTFSGDVTRFNSVDVNKGRLVLSSQDLTIKGDVSLAAGAGLQISNGWTLHGGQVFDIHSDGAVSAANRATFTGNLTLEEGSLVNVGTFTNLNGNLVMDNGYMAVSGLAMSQSDATLSISGNVSGSVLFSITDTATLVAGTDYLLATSDWSLADVEVELAESPYLTATVGKTDHGLYVTFQTTKDSYVWDGSQESHTWDGTHFGQQATVPGARHTAVFSNAATNQDVVIAGNSTVGTMVVDSTKDYVFHSDTGNVVTTDTLVKSGSGRAVVSQAVVVGTAGNLGTVEINGGELVVTSAATLAHIESITGAGTLGISYQNASESVFFHTNSDCVGALHIENGSYIADVGLHYDDLILGSNSTYTIGANKTIYGAVTVNGSNAVLNLQNRTLTAGEVVLEDNLSLKGSGGQLAAPVYGEGRTVSTSGNVTINHSAFNADLNVTADNTHLAGGTYSEIGTITLAPSAVLTINSSAAVTNMVDISMGEGAKINLENGNGSINSLVANISMAGNYAEIDGTYNGNNTSVQGYITGQGTLKLGTYDGHTNAWRLDSTIADAEDRTLAVSINSNVTLTAANSYSGGTTISGSTVQVSNENAFAGGSLDMTGGTLKLNSNLNLTQLSGTGGTLQLNGKRLTLTGNGGAVNSFAGTFSGTGSLVKTGSANQVFTQAVALTDLAVNGGTLQLGGGSASGRVTVAQGAELRINDNDFTISSAVENAGTFAFSGATHKLILDPSGAFEQESLGYRDITGGTESGNGFAQGTAIKVVNNREGAQISNVDTVGYLGDTLRLDAQTGYATMGASTSVYTVRKGTVAYNDDFTSRAAASGISVFSLAGESADAAATFSLEKGLANGVSILSAGFGGNVDIGKDVVLNADQLQAQARTTLTGSGTYVLNQTATALPGEVSLGKGTQWTGVVRISGQYTNMQQTINALDNAERTSSVELRGVSGWLGGNVDANIILSGSGENGTGTAVTITDGSTGATRVFSGTVSGHGNYYYNWNNGGAGQTHSFSGDVSGWDGSFIVGGNIKNATALEFSGKATRINADVLYQGGNTLTVRMLQQGAAEMNGDISHSSGSVNVVVGNTSSNTEAVFNGNLQNVNSLELNTGSSATLAGDANVLGGLLINRDSTLFNTGRTTLGGDISNFGGFVVNSGTLDYGSLAGLDSVTNKRGGNIIVNKALTFGTIENYGDITISSLMQGTVSGYEDARGQTSPDGNGFATTSLTVRGGEASIINHDGGRILYGGNDVTDEVLQHGTITTRVNHGTYFIKTTDDNVTYSAIAEAAGDALEYISFKDGTQLKVDDGATSNIRTSQVKVEGTVTLSMQGDSTLEVDATTAARVVEATAGSTLNLRLNGDSGTRMTLGALTVSGSTVNVDGSGVLSLGGNQYGIKTLNIRGGTVYSNRNNGTAFTGHNTVNIYGGGTLQLASKDNMGWQGNATLAINMEGSENAAAVLELGGRQTFSTALNLKGNSVVRVMGGASFTGEDAPMLDPYGGGSISVSGKDNLLAVPVRMRQALTITVAQNGELSFDGGVKYQNGTYNKTLTKAGEGMLTLTGSGHQYTNSQVIISAGTLAVDTDATFCNLQSSGAMRVNSCTTGITQYTGSAGSSVSVAAGATLAFNGTATLGGIIQNAGTVSFNGAEATVTLQQGGDYDVRGRGYMDVATGEFSANGNGLYSTGSVRVVQGGTVEVADGVSVQYGGTAYTLRADGCAYGEENVETYYVRSGSAAYTDAVAAVDTITTVELSGSATLNLQTALAEGVDISSAGGTVDIAEGVQLSGDRIHATRATALTGGGVYAVNLADGGTLGSNISLGGGWSGTLRLSGTASGPLALNTIAGKGGGYSAVEMAGATAALQAGDINPDITLTDLADGQAALTVTGADTFTFAGNISGSGRLVNNAAGASTYNLVAANLAGWNGAVVNNGGSLAVNLAGSGSATSVNGSFIGIDRLSSADGDITVDTVQTRDGGTALNGTGGTLTIANLTGSGAVTVSGSVALGGEYAGASITVSAPGDTLHLGNFEAGQAVLHNGGAVELTGDQAVLGGVEGNGSIQAQAGSIRTLEIAGADDYASGAAIGAGINLVRAGTGTQAFNGDMHAFNGEVETISGKLALAHGASISVLTLSGGELEFSGAGTTTIGAARVATGAHATLAVQDGTLSLRQAMLNAGALTLSGIIDVSNLEMQTSNYGYTDVGGTRTDSGSGFATVQSAVEVVRNVVAGSLVTQDATVKYGNLTAKLDEDGWARFDTGREVIYGTYYLRDNNVQNLTLSRIQQAARDGGDELAKVVVDNIDSPVNLGVDTEAGIGMFRVDEDCTAKLDITAAGELSAPERYRGVDGSIILSGEGRYRLSGMDTLGGGISLSQEGWNGTVVLTGHTAGLDLSSGSPLWLDRGADSTGVGFDGWSGDLADSGWATQARILIGKDGMRIEGAALSSTEAASYVFENAVSGGGDITNARQGASEFIFSAESDWNGSFIAEAGDTDITYFTEEVNNSVQSHDGNATVSLLGNESSGIQVNGGFSRTGTGSLNVFVLSDTTFNGEADVTSLYVEDGVSAHIAASFAADSITGFGGLAVDNGGRLILNGDIENLGSTIANSGTITFAEKCVITLYENGSFTQSASSYRDLDGSVSDTGNGFRASGGLMVIQNANGGTIQGADNVTLEHAHMSYAMDENGQLVNPDDAHTYYIHTGTVSYSRLAAADGLVAIHLNDREVPGSTPTLVLDKNLADSVTGGIISDGGTIGIAGGVTLQSSRLFANGDTTLAGSGTFELGAAVDMRGAILGGEWSGTVAVTDARNVQGLDISSLSVAGSTVRLSGVTGSLAENIAAAGTLELADSGSTPALLVTSADSSKTYTLGGTVTGSGTLEAAANATYKLSGDLSQWDGAFRATANDTGTTSVLISGNTVADNTIDIGADIRNNGGNAAHKLNVDVDVDTAHSRINLSGELEGINTLTYKANAVGRTLHIGQLTTNNAGTTVQLKDGNYAATVEIAYLHGSGILSLNNICKSDNLTHFAINGGDYTGEYIDFTAMKAGYSGGNRCVLLTLGDETVAQNSVVRIGINNTGNRVDAGVSINAPTVRVGGLADRDGNNLGSKTRFNLVSGNPADHTAPSEDGFTSDSTVRTLVITGKGGSTAAKVGSSLNLTMDSAGNTQSFTGDMSLFTGAIVAQAGTLNLNSAALNLHAVSVAHGASLALGADADATLTPNATIANAGSLTLRGTVQLDNVNRLNFEVLGGGTPHYDGKDAYEGSGYITSDTQYYLVHGTADSTLDTTALNPEFTGGAWVKDAGTDKDIVVTFAGSGERTGTYYVNGSFDYNEEEMGGATAFVVDQAATFNAVPLAKATTLAFGGEGRVVVTETVGDGGTFSFTGIQEGFRGTLSIYRGSQSTGHGKNIALHNFSGTLEIKGRYDLSGSSFDNAQKLVINGDRASSNTGFWLHGNGTKTLTQDIELTGENDVQFEITDNTTNLVATGEVTGNKLWKTGSAKMTFDGNVDVASAKVGGGTAVFNGDLAAGVLTNTATTTITGTARAGSLSMTSGTLNINGGSLSITGSAESTIKGTVNIAAGGSLDIAGAVSSQSNATVVNNGSLDLTAAPSQVKLGALTLNQGSSLALDAEGMLSIGGALTLNRGAALDLSGLALSDTQEMYVLAAAGSISLADGVDLLLSDPAYSDKASLGVAGNNLVLTLAHTAIDLQWRGEDGTWTTDAVAKNWYLDGTTTETAFIQGDNARFGEASDGHTATLAENITAGALAVNEDASVTVALNGHDLATGSLTVESGSALAINGGGRTLEAAAANIGGAVSIGNGTTLKLNGGESSFTLGKVTLNNGSKLDVAAAGSVTAESLFVADASGAEISLAQDMTVTAGESADSKAGALYTMGAGQTLNIHSADAADPKSLTVDKLDIANSNTGVSLQNVVVNVKEAATVGVLTTDRSNDTGRMTVGGGATLNFNGSVDWHKANSSDVVNLTVQDGGAVHVNHGTANTLNDITVQDGGSLSFAAGTTTAVFGSVSLAEQIANSGTLDFGGRSIAISLTGDGTAFHITPGHYTNIDGETDENGFYHSMTGAISTGNGTMENAGGVLVTFGEETASLNQDGTLGSVVSTAYHVRSGKVDYSTLKDSPVITSVALSNNATLNLDAALAANVGIASTGGTVEIGSGVALQAGSLTVSDATSLAGGGSYVLGSGEKELGSNLTLSADWTGRVVLSGPAGTTVTAINLQNSAPGTENAVSTSQSTIELRGIQGWLAHTGTGAANANDANLILTNPEAGVSALKLDNGSTNATTYFTGSISGSGDLEHAWTKSTPYLEMSGDLSGWTGNIVKSSGGTVGFTLNNNPGGNIAVGALAKAGTLNLTVKNGSAVTLSGNFAQSGGTLNLTVNANATFTGTLSGVSSLSVESGKTATLVKAATVGGLSGAGSVSADSVTLNGTGSSTLNGAVSVTNRLVKDGSGTQTFSGDAVLNGLTVNAGTLKFTREGGVSVNALSGTGGTLDVADTLTVANADANEFGGALAVGGLVKDGAGTLTLHGISRIENGIDMQGGSLVFAAGTYNLGGLENIHSEGYSEKTHGYRVASDSVRLVNTGVGVSAADGANFVIGSVQGAALLDDGYVGKTATDYATYFLVDGTGVDLNREIDKGRGLSSVNVLDGTGTIGLSAYASISGLTLAGGSAAAITGGHELTLTGNSVIGASAHVDIGEGSALRLMHGGSAAAVVMSATGAGDIVLGVSATLSNNATTAATGKLSVGTGATLTIGTGDSQNNNLSSFSGVELDGGRIYWNSAGAASGTTSMKNLSTTSRGGTFQIYDINGNPIVLGGTTTLNGNLTLENSVWGNGLTIQKLTGTGSLNATSTNSSDSLTLAINSIENFSGGISIVNPKTTLNANMGDDVKLAHLTLNAGTANIKGDFSAGALIGSGSGNLHLDNVTLDVTADSSYSGTLSIGGKLVKNGAARQTLSVGTVDNPFLMNEVYDLNAGTLALAGYITINRENFTPASSTYMDTNGGEHVLGQGSGYQTAKGDVTVVNVKSGATLDVTDANFTYNGREVDVNAQGRFTLPEQETAYDSYYVFTDNTSLLEVQQTSTSVGESLTDLYLQESGSLNAAGASKLASLHVKDTTVEGDVANLAGPASVGSLTGRGILSVNGSLNADTVGADATATLTLAGAGTATIGSLENGATGSLVFSGASATIGGNSTYAGNITIAGTVKVTGEGSLGSMDASLHTITIDHGGILDVNGHEGTKQGSLDGYTVVFAGGTLTNTGTGMGSSKRQYVTHATLTADSTINAQREFGITGGNYAATSLDLGEYTLEKTGGNTFWLSKTTVTGSGSIKVTQGTLAFQQGGTYAANIELAGGNVSGSLNLGGDVSVSASANASMGEVNLNGHALNANAASGKTLRVTDAVSGGDSSTIRKTGEGAVALSGSMANFSGSIDAQGGILNLFNQTALSVQDVVLADGATVGAYTTAAADDTNEATLTVSGTLAARGADVRLNANVVMESGSTLDVRATGGAGLLMGSDVTLSKGMTLNDYSSDWATWKDGTTYTLFTGVDGLDIGNGVTTGTMDYTQWVDAKEYFDNIQESNRYFLCFGGAPDQNAQGVLTAVNDGSNVGMVYIMTMPEPTTSTLSLLALAALAARRRRNS